MTNFCDVLELELVDVNYQSRGVRFGGHVEEISPLCRDRRI
jgi:hypothetical protein